MTTTYSIAEARNQFAALIRQVEEGQTSVQVTRRGEPVAVILSQEAYKELLARPPRWDFWTAYQKWRQAWSIDEMDIDPDEVWGDVRDRRPVPDVNPWLQTTCWTPTPSPNLCGGSQTCRCWPVYKGAASKSLLQLYVSRQYVSFAKSMLRHELYT